MLDSLGWNEEWQVAFAPFGGDGLEPGRVAVEHRGAFVVLTAHGELLAEVTGRMRFDGSAFPAAGDWVVVRRLPEGRGLIHAVLPRVTKLARKDPGPETIEQVLAANIDVVFCVDSCEIRERRLERYVSAAWDSGAAPVVVLTKADLCDDPLEASSTAESVSPGVPVHVTSAVSGDGVEDLRGYFAGNRTVVMIGPSGVGKSTLINRLFGEERLLTAEIRDDGRGRHTTIRRELVVLPSGGVVLDTPGLRELALWTDEGISSAFDDVESLAESCRFRDCRHEREPGCAVRGAIDDGSLELARFQSYRKLERELAHLAARQNKRAAIDTKRRWKAITKAHRQRARFDRR